MTYRHPPSDRMLDEVEEHVPRDRGLLPSEIHERVGQWSPVSIRTALGALAAAGRIVYEGPDMHRRYRRELKR